jgi:hypothetical protein
MSELTTADLAGGTTPRDRKDHDPRMADTRDPRMATPTRDPMADDRDPKMATPEARPAGSDFERRAEATFTPASTSTSTSAAHRTSQLANPAATDGATSDNGAAPLFPTGEVESFRSRWVEVQTGFVDEPRHAVEQADGLVAEMMKRLATVFADERAKLEEQWSRGDDISTEDLRQALRRYRSFFDRLLSV